MDRMKKKDAEIRRLSKEAADYKKRAYAAESKIVQYENFRSYNEQRDVDFDEELKKERDMYKQKIMKQKGTEGIIIAESYEDAEN